MAEARRLAAALIVGLVIIAAAKGADVKTETVAIKSIRVDAGNRRLHPEDNLGFIKRSLLKYGQQKPIVVNASGVVVAGNGTLLAARALGWSEIAIVRTALPPKLARQYAIADNRTGETSDWDVKGLVSDLKEFEAGGDDIADLGFTPDDMVGYQTQIADGADVVEDEVPEPPRKAVAKIGEVWSLGDHRILCGDSTKADDVASVMRSEHAVLMNTDPPYGIDYVGLKDGIPVSGMRDLRKRHGDIVSDDLVDGASLQAFLESAIRVAVPHLKDSCAFYLWHPMLTQGTFFAAAAAAAADILIHRQIIWIKPSLVLTRSGMYHWKHELCFYGWRRGHQPPWYGDKSQTTVWALGRDAGGHHPTQKPVALFVPPIKNHTRSGEVVYEPFSGSGTQIIAAEQLGRKCRAIEIEPRYVDVAIERWQTLTGGKAARHA